MSLTNAMLVGFTGIKSNTVAVDTVGNNLANLSTTAFKGQRTLFETLLYRTIDEGNGPSATSGGTLPRQIGTGSGVAGLQRNFLQGGLEGTGFSSDLALEGDGFFVLAQPNREQVYTRDGSFRLDATNTLVASNGSSVQVLTADNSGAIDTGTLTNLVVPLGSRGDAVATTEVIMEGQLDSSTSVAAASAVSTSAPLVTSGGTAATGSTSLTDVVNEIGVNLFADGDELRIGGQKGGTAVEESTFVVGTTGNTLDDLAAHMETVLGIQADANAASTPGVTISDGTDFPAGAIVVTSNLGETNSIELDDGSVVNTTGPISSPLSFTTATAALGGGSDGVTTSFNVFDSLGNPVDVRLRLVMESKSDAGTQWRFFAESNGDTDLSPVLGNGTIAFDANGRFVSATATDLTIDRTGVGSTTPLSFNLDLSRLTGLTSPDGKTEITMASQDGTPSGVMTGYGIDPDGMITAVFSNQREVVLGQIAVATFINNEGLIALSNNAFASGPNSGEATIGAPQVGTAGTVRSGSLEQSNVEIAREFINLISASTGISAASRVVRASDDLLQELLLLAR